MNAPKATSRTKPRLDLGRGWNRVGFLPCLCLPLILLTSKINNYTQFAQQLYV